MQPEPTWYKQALVVAVAILGALALLASSAGAQPTLGEVVDAVQNDGIYVESGSGVSEGDVARALGSVSDVAVVVLADDDPLGAGTAADQVRDALGTDTVVLLISPGEFGASDSDFFTDDELAQALDAVGRVFDGGGDTADAVEAFVATLDAFAGTGDPATDDGGGSTAVEPEPAGTASAADSDSSGGGAGGFLVFILVIVVLFGGFIWWAKRKARKVDTGEVDRARAEIRSQLEAVARDIVELEATVDVSGNPQAIDHYREASATYTRVAEDVEETENLIALAELNDDIDRARWQLEAAQALIEGRPVPPEPEPDKPAACFFDPTHKPGVEEAVIKTSAGEKEVRVCRSCADKLERGERPEPRMIDVRGKRVPAAKAPKSHGGLGMGGLSIFEVILGGLGALAAGRGRRSGAAAPTRASRASGVGLDWGDMLPKRRPSGDVFGPDRQPGRPRGLPRTPASRPPSRSSGRTRTRSRPSRSSSRTRRRSR